MEKWYYDQLKAYPKLLRNNVNLSLKCESTVAKRSAIAITSLNVILIVNFWEGIRISQSHMI